MAKITPSSLGFNSESIVTTVLTYRFDPIDLTQLYLAGQLSAGQRLQRMLNARALAVGLIRSRLRRQYPNLSPPDLNLKVLEEIERAKRIVAPRF